jgi:hypothetical protein
MNKLILGLLVLATCSCGTGKMVTNETKNVDKKYVVWYSPSPATDVYGLMFNFFPTRKDVEPEYPNIYGMEFNISPAGLLALMAIVPYAIIPNTDIKTHENRVQNDSYKQICGLQVGILNFEPSIIHGIDINPFLSLEDSQVNGLTISGLANQHETVNGLTVAVIGNNDAHCRGVQVGLFNTCADLRGIQIGLWNKNQRRSLPLINWSFRKKTD